MKCHVKFIMKNCILVTLILFILIWINKVLMDKSFFNSDYPSTAIYKNFYKLDEDTVNVLFLGSSHCVSSFDPQVLYDEFGITSYNLGSGGQSIMVSYYWLKEALRYQSPDAVILDTYMFFDYHGQEYFNASEGSIRIAIDPMRWSKVKWEAMNDICEHDEAHTLSSYLFINERYHERWTDLTQEDFQFSKMYAHQDLKGFSGFTVRAGNEGYAPFVDGYSDEKVNIHYYMADYLEKIVELCEENEIELILVKTPATMENVERYNETLEFAESHGLKFWDLNLKEHYDESGFEFAEDMSSGGHANIWGAQKITAYIGKLLNEHCVFSEVSSYDKWEESKAYHEKVMYDCELTQITDINEYIQWLKGADYTVFLAISTDIDLFKKEEEMRKFQAGFGVDMDLKGLSSYVAVLYNGEVLAEEVEERINHYGIIDSNKVDYHVVCNGIDKERNCSILINNKEYSMNRQGINIVVYSNDRMKVVYSVNYLNGVLSRR